MSKKTKYRDPVNWKKELRLAPGYLILLIWISFTFVLLGWLSGLRSLRITFIIAPCIPDSFTFLQSIVP